MAQNLAELWTEIKGDVEHAVAMLEDEAKAVIAYVLPVIEADVVAVLSQFKKLAIDTAINLVTAEATRGLSHEEKQGQIVTTVFQAAEAEGKTMALETAQTLATQVLTSLGAAANNQVTPQPN